MVIMFPSKAHETSFEKLQKIWNDPAYRVQGVMKEKTSITHMGHVIEVTPFFACCIRAATDLNRSFNQEMFLWLLNQNGHFIEPPA